MIKIRLHGLPEEIEAAKKNLEYNFKFRSVSSNYSDRGNSKLERVYIDADPIEERNNYIDALENYIKNINELATIAYEINQLSSDDKTKLYFEDEYKTLKSFEKGLNELLTIAKGGK